MQWTTKCTTCFTIKLYWKIDFYRCFVFVKQMKNKVYVLTWVFKLLGGRFQWLGKHKSPYEKSNIIIVHFLLHVLLHFFFLFSLDFLLHKVFIPFPWNFVNFSMNFYLQVKQWLSSIEMDQFYVKQELLSHRKSRTSAKTNGQIATKGT